MIIDLQKDRFDTLFFVRNGRVYYIYEIYDECNMHEVSDKIKNLIEYWKNK